MPPGYSRLTNADWTRVAVSPGRYLGARVALTGQVFHVLGSRDGSFHFQMYTEPAAHQGNTHVAVPGEPPAIHIGDTVLVVGTLEQELVTASVAGTELRLPYVVAESVHEAGSGEELARSSAPPDETPGPVATDGPAAADPDAAGPLTVEAEAGQVALPMEVRRDAAASGGAYVATTQSNQGWDGRGQPPQTGRVDLEVLAPRSGQYVVWARLWYEHANANSVWLRIDGQETILLGNEEAGYRTWKWVNWRNGQTGQQAAVPLSAGRHQLSLIGREAGARVDQLVLTDDPTWTPAEAAPAAETTPAEHSRSAATASAAPAPAGARPTRASTPAPPAATPIVAQESYLVQPGDSLSSIAARRYGDASQWRRLYEANLDQLTSPDRLQPGQRLRLPRSRGSRLRPHAA